MARSATIVSDKPHAIDEALHLHAGTIGHGVVGASVVGFTGSVWGSVEFPDVVTSLVVTSPSVCPCSVDAGVSVGGSVECAFGVVSASVAMEVRPASVGTTVEPVKSGSSASMTVGWNTIQARVIQTQSPV